ncbi:MAG: glycosyltransferase [Planctomycetota bacterium]
MADVTLERKSSVAGGPGVVCFGGEDWWYHNRGHFDIQIMKHLAERMPVLYVNSIVMRKFNVGEGGMFWKRLARKARSIGRGLVRAGENFHVYSPLALPVHHVAGAREANARLVREQVAAAGRRLGMARPIIWVACPAACDAALAMERRALAYQRTDRYEEYPGTDAEQIRAYDRRLKEAADATFYVNHRMMEEETSECRRAVFLDHGVDFERFAEAEESGVVPREIAGIKGPIAGYYGDIDAHIVDVEMLETLAGILGEFHFVFVGTSTTDVKGLASRENVTMIGRRPYEEIAQYGKRFDVAIMPWRSNRWIDSCNPVKLKEYLALGKPVVSTPFSELEYYRDVVYAARGAEGFAAAIRQAAAEDGPERIARRRERVRGYSWESRAELALGALAEPDTAATP